MEATDHTAGAEFERFLGTAERRLRVALTAAYGPADGRAAAVDALSWAWEHWPKVREMANPAGYLFRVGQTAAPIAVHDTNESISGMRVTVLVGLADGTTLTVTSTNLTVAELLAVIDSIEWVTQAEWEAIYDPMPAYVSIIDETTVTTAAG